MTNLESKFTAYLQFLRSQFLEDGLERELIESLSDTEILELSRKCCGCNETLYTKEQETHAILEFDTPQRTYEVLLEASIENINLEEKLIRGEGIFDGASSIEEAINMLYSYANLLAAYKKQGFELAEAIDEDVGFLIKDDDN